MMNGTLGDLGERKLLRGLTLAALFNAIFLALLGVQFVAPLAVAVLIWVLPAVFAVEVARVPLRVSALSCLVIIGLALLLFSLDVGGWAIVYIGAGLVAGAVRRWRWPAAIRALLIAIALIALMGGLIELFFWLAHLDVRTLVAPLDAAIPYHIAPALTLLGLGFLITGCAIGAATDWLITRILSRLPRQ